MQKYQLTVNNKNVEVEAEADTPLLWILRDWLDLTGTKFGCGVNSCGACTVLFNNHAVRSCQVPVSSCGKNPIITIEGLSADGNHPVQKAWAEEGVPQCGYCQAGQMMTLAGLLLETKKPTEEEVSDVLSQNLCRCGTYHRIQKAVQRAIALTNQ
jgi:isoquinoline 1-oxidoreductase alpha subunit